MSNITELDMEKTFPECGELYQRLSDLLDEYGGELSLVAVIGILELKKHNIMKGTE